MNGRGPSTVKVVSMQKMLTYRLYSTKRVQRVVGIFLYYERAIDNTILPTLNEIFSSQSKPTKNTNKNTNKKILMLLDYLSTYSNAKIRFTASDIILHVNSGAVFLVVSKGTLTGGRLYYCNDDCGKATTSIPLSTFPSISNIKRLNILVHQQLMLKQVNSSMYVKT